MQHVAYLLQFGNQLEPPQTYNSKSDEFRIIPVPRARANKLTVDSWTPI